MPILHFYRENVFAKRLSELLLIESGRFCYSAEDKNVTVRPFHVNSEECLKDMEIYLNGVKQVSYVLSKAKELITVKYEDLYESSEINRKVIEEFAEVINIHDLGRIYTSMKKTPVKYTEVVLNHYELLTFFKDSQFEDMVVDVFQSKPL